MDVAGTAVGIASLGIQVLQGLIQYYGDWKDRDKDVRTTCNAISGLEDILSLVRSSLTSSNVAAAERNVVQNSVLSCEGAIKALEKRLDKIRVKRLDDEKRFASFKDSALRALYPFKKSTLIKVQETLADIRANLGVALTVLSINLTDGNRKVLEAVSESVGETAKLVEKIEKFHMDTESRLILDWLSPLNFTARYHDILKTHQPGTGEWLLQHDLFRQWVHGPPTLLWCPGIHGVGKTVLSAVVVEFIKKKILGQDALVVYVLCDRTDPTQTASNLLAALVQQAARQTHTIPQPVQELFEECERSGNKPTLTELTNVLFKLVSTFKDAYVVIDALDECREEDGTRDDFLEGINKIKGNTNILVTSRHIPSIGNLFEGHQVLEICAQNDDIRRYVEARISGSRERRLRKIIGQDQDLKEKILSVITEKADGMYVTQSGTSLTVRFLLAQMHVDSLANKSSKRDLRNALESLPKKLDETYEKAWDRIQSQDADDAELANRVLTWLCFSPVPLGVLDIQRALAVSEDGTVDEDSIIDEELLVSVCCGLVKVEAQSETYSELEIPMAEISPRRMRLMHYTTQEYFQRVKNQKFPKAHLVLGRICLNYLSSKSFPASHYVVRYKELGEKYTFARYVLQNWGYHARYAMYQGLLPIVWNYLSSEAVETSYDYFRDYMTPIAIYGKGLQGYETPLHLATYFGLIDVVDALTEGEPSIERFDAMSTKHRQSQISDDLGLINWPTSAGVTPLFLASSMGHDKVFKLLISRGADVRVGRDCYFDSCLHIALRCKQGGEILDAILEGEPDSLNMPDFLGVTPFARCLLEPDASLLEELLVKAGDRLDVQTPFHDGCNALFYALQRGRSLGIPRILFEHAGKRLMRDDSGRIIVQKGKQPWLCYCDGCDRSLKESGDTFWHCNLCQDGDFDLCDECKALEKRHCAVADHEMVHLVLE